MPFVLNRALLAKSDDVPPHVAAAQAHQEHLRSEHHSAMGHGADRPVTDEEAARLDGEEEVEKGIRQHPTTGRFMGHGETAYGAQGAALVTALAQHQGPRPGASLTTTPAVSLGSSIAPGEVQVQNLDYRTGGAPRPSFTPIQPAPHTAPNTPGIG